MPHKAVKLAGRVLSDVDAYPEIVVRLADDIVRLDLERRQAIRAMWNNRKLWHDWISLRARYCVGTTKHKGNRKATDHLKGMYTADLMNILYAGRQAISDRDPFRFEKDFVALMQLVESNDYQLIYRYFACVNARRCDLQLEAVGFIRECPIEMRQEVIAWKLMKAIDDQS